MSILALRSIAIKGASVIKISQICNTYQIKPAYLELPLQSSPGVIDIELTKWIRQ